MAEMLLGGVAGSKIGRLALTGDSFNTGFGYGVHFTDSRIIVLSYRRILSRSYYPFYLTFLVFAVWLASALTFSSLAGIPQDQPEPILFGPPPALAILDLMFFYIICPRLARTRIARQAPRTLLDLVNQTPEVTIQRVNIAQVTVDGYRINILDKSDQWYSFIAPVSPRTLYSDPTKWKAQAGELFELFKRFCSLEPPITMWMKHHSHWEILTGPNVHFPV